MFEMRGKSRCVAQRIWMGRCRVGHCIPVSIISHPNPINRFLNLSLLPFCAQKNGGAMTFCSPGPFSSLDALCTPL